jgi:hypothetical protein
MHDAADVPATWGRRRLAVVAVLAVWLLSSPPTPFIA